MFLYGCANIYNVIIITIIIIKTVTVVQSEAIIRLFCAHYPLVIIRVY